MCAHTRLLFDRHSGRAYFVKCLPASYSPMRRVKIIWIVHKTQYPGLHIGTELSVRGKNLFQPKKPIRSVLMAGTITSKEELIRQAIEKYIIINGRIPRWVCANSRTRGQYKRVWNYPVHLNNSLPDHYVSVYPSWLKWFIHHITPLKKPKK